MISFGCNYNCQLSIFLLMEQRNVPAWSLKLNEFLKHFAFGINDGWPQNNRNDVWYLSPMRANLADKHFLSLTFLQRPCVQTGKLFWWKIFSRDDDCVQFRYKVPLFTNIATFSSGEPQPLFCSRYFVRHFSKSKKAEIRFLSDSCASSFWAVFEFYDHCWRANIFTSTFLGRS